MTRVLLDEGLPLRAAQWLRDRGIDAIHAREAGLAAAPDAGILKFALAERRVCITLDHDFHGILAETAANAPSVILLRIQQASYIEAAVVIERLLKEFHSQLVQGIALTASARGVRFRKLPLK
jgi:predicted nuclease of predicted toxin-antitoxin system